MKTEGSSAPLVVLALLVSIPMRLWACEPCAEEWNFGKTVARADIVIVGQKIAEGPHSNFGQEPGGPEWIDVRVTQVLKGDVEGGQIRVSCWYAMCPYGIIIDAKPHVVLLIKPDPRQGRPYYDAVNHGCAVKTYLVENETVQFNGQPLSLDEFVLWLKKVAEG